MRTALVTLVKVDYIGGGVAYFIHRQHIRGIHSAKHGG